MVAAPQPSNVLQQNIPFLSLHTDLYYLGPRSAFIIHDDIFNSNILKTLTVYSAGHVWTTYFMLYYSIITL